MKRTFLLKVDAAINLINLCGGGVLALWLLSDTLNLPLRGQILLWFLVLLLIGLSLFEGFAHLRKAATGNT